MIFVTTGTLQTPFIRLINYIREYSQNTSQKILIQCGNYYYQSTPNITYVSYLEFEQMKRYYSQANCVISAAGEGSLLQILQYSKYLGIYFPRRKKYSEHVDDQQYFTSLEIKRRHWGQVSYTKQQLFQAMKTKQSINPYKNKLILSNNQLIAQLDRITIDAV